MAGEQIPVIDISNIDEASGAQLVDAVHDWGFAFIKGSNTGFSAPLIDRLFELSGTLFKLPSEEKESCAISSNNKGWSRLHSETLDPKNQKKGDLKEAFNFGEFVNGKAQQPIPPSLAHKEAEIGDFADRCSGLCMQLLRLFALGLKISETDGGQAWFARHHDASKGPSGSILRLLYYPAPGACLPDTDASALRAGAHSDYGSITLLFQRSSQPGLEVLSPQTDWSSVPVWPPGTEGDQYPPILVNVGDLLSYWTNGFLKSTVHRVVFPPNGGSTDRYSVAYFCHPANDTKLAPVPSEVVTTALASTGTNRDVLTGSRTLTAEDHLRSRLAATYGWEKGRNGES
ncbi:MAG: hypothetical protein L6R38_001126 [Xanthoria sp. 2 TBL-2021]|nr:MAG: hypothetical protein L6R38_001126 [Xanthoria sp. 2 TBL-2021]